MPGKPKPKVNNGGAKAPKPKAAPEAKPAARNMQRQTSRKPRPIRSTRGRKGPSRHYGYRAVGVQSTGTPPPKKGVKQSVTPPNVSIGAKPRFKAASKTISGHGFRLPDNLARKPGAGDRHGIASYTLHGKNKITGSMSGRFSAGGSQFKVKALESGVKGGNTQLHIRKGSGLISTKDAEAGRAAIGGAIPKRVASVKGAKVAARVTQNKSNFGASSVGAERQAKVNAAAPGPRAMAGLRGKRMKEA